MDLRQLELFCAVVDQGDVSKAAQATYCSQPVLSTQIKKLERELGHRLFDRSKRPMELTAAGRQVYKFAQSMNGMYRMLTRELGTHTKQSVSIGASTVPAAHLLPSVLQHVHQSYPQAQFCIRHGDSLQIAHMVAEEVVDFGVVGTVNRDLSCVYTPLCDDHLVVALPAIEPYQTLATAPDWHSRLADLPCLARTQGSGTRKHGMMLLERLGVCVDAISIAARFEDQEALCHSLVAGLGWSVISQMVARPYVDAGKMLTIELGADDTRPFYVVTKTSPAQIDDELVCRCIATLHELHAPASTR